MVFTEKITIAAYPPFSFNLSAKIFAEGDREIRRYENGKFSQVIRVNSKLILVTLESMGSEDKPKLSADLKSSKPLTEEDKKKAEETIEALFNLNFNLSPFYEEVKHDEVMACLTQKLRGLKSPTTQTVFEALVDSIVEQQISLKVANSLERKLIKNYGETLNLQSEVYYAYPTPQKIAATKVEDLRQCGLSQRKAEYIKEISAQASDGKLDLEKFKNYSNANDIIKELDEVRGIGVWTAELTMIRGMQKWEAMPADDLGLRRVISQYYCNGNQISSAQARQIAKGWGQWKGLAAYYLVVADMLGIEV